MIGNGHPYGSTGYVIVEEGEINPTTYRLEIKNYLVIRPDGDQVSGAFSLSAAREYIDATELKLRKNNNLD